MLKCSLIIAATFALGISLAHAGASASAASKTGHSAQTHTMQSTSGTTIGEFSSSSAKTHAKPKHH